MIIISLLLFLNFSLNAMESNNEKNIVKFSDCIEKNYKQEIERKVDYLEKHDETHNFLFIYYLIQAKLSNKGMNALAQDYENYTRPMMVFLKQNNNYQASLNKALEFTATVKDSDVVKLSWDAFRKNAAYILEDYMKANTRIVFPDHKDKPREAWEKEFFEKNKETKITDHDIDSFIAAGLVLFNNQQIQYNTMHKELPAFMKDDNTNQ